jgi:putative phosphoribosyl transferase
MRTASRRDILSSQVVSMASQIIPGQVTAEGGEQPVHVAAGSISLEATLTVPEQASGIVIFAHGSGSSRHSLRTRKVARELNAGGLATLLLDLLTPNEEKIDIQTHHLRFDIPLLSERLLHATDWIVQNPDMRALRVGYFGASTGAAAALLAAAECPESIGAVVCRSGRPDLAGSALRRVRAPTLLIVGGHDFGIIELNRSALARLSGDHQLALVPGATRLFEEPGALCEVARLARSWFEAQLSWADDAHGLSTA